jgi:hypothetical protein
VCWTLVWSGSMLWVTDCVAHGCSVIEITHRCRMWFSGLWEHTTSALKKNLVSFFEALYPPARRQGVTNQKPQSKSFPPWEPQTSTPFVRLGVKLHKRNSIYVLCTVIHLHNNHTRLKLNSGVRVTEPLLTRSHTQLLELSPTKIFTSSSTAYPLENVHLR